MSFYFGKKDQRKSVRVTVRLEKDLYIQLVNQDQNISETIRQALYDFVESNNNSKKQEIRGDSDEIGEN